MEEDKIKVVRIKGWFLISRTKYREFKNDKGVTDETWWKVDFESDKAYHLAKREYLWEGGWVPKTAIREEKEI